MTINLFDDSAWFSLRPLTFTRPVADLRIGILTIGEKWSKYLNADFGFTTQHYLHTKYPSINAELYINGAICPDQQLIEAISGLGKDEVLVKDGLTIAYRTASADLSPIAVVAKLKNVSYTGTFNQIKYPEDIFKLNHEELVKDFALLTKGKTSGTLSSTNTILGRSNFCRGRRNRRMLYF
jgi:hypothetical protein